jgi:uncharacterized membrane protein
MFTAKTAGPRRGVSNAFFAIVATCSTALLVPFLNKSIYRDEGATVYSARLSWAALWRESLVTDRVLLPYYVLLHLWFDLSYNIEFARLLSLLAYGLTAYCVGVLANRAAGFWCGLLAVVLTCSNPLMINAALDGRPYALATLVAVLSVAALLRWFDGGELHFLWIFSVLAIATAVLQLFIVLAPLSALGACVVLKPQTWRRQWRSSLPPIVLLVAAVVAFFALVAHQQGQIAWISGLKPKRFLEDTEGPASSGHIIYPVVIAAIGLLALAGCILVWRRRSSRPSRLEVDRLVVFACWSVLPTVLLVLVTAVKPVYVDRYVTGSVPGMAITLALLITYAIRGLATSSSLPERTIVGAMAIACLVILIANSVTVSRAPNENLRGAAQYIMRNASHTSEVAIPSHFLTGGVEYYLDRSDSPLRLWPQRSGRRFNAGLVLSESASTFATTPGSVWLVNDGSANGVKGFISSLTSHGFDQVNSKSFLGVKVFHFLRH